MNTPKLHETKKLHYGKYLYKVNIASQLSGIFRTELQRNGKLAYARSKLDEYAAAQKSGYVTINTKFRAKVSIDADELLDANNIYTVLKNSADYLLRCEYKKLIVYTNDSTTVSKLTAKVAGNMEIWQPTPKTAEFLQNNLNTIIVNNATNYPFKITFGFKPAKPELAAWAEKNADKVQIGSVLMKNLQKGNKYIQGQYIFARDENIIMLLQMIIGDNIARIDKLVYKADIDK